MKLMRYTVSNYILKVKPVLVKYRDSDHLKFMLNKDV